jgi:hypothetical protein
MFHPLGEGIIARYQKEGRLPPGEMIRKEGVFIDYDA